MFLLISFLVLVVIINRFAKQTQTILFRAVYGWTKNLTFATYVIAALYLPGVIIHELSHLVVAVFLLLDVKGMSLIPHAEPTPGGIGLQLGSVEYYRQDPIRGAIVGIAPFIVGNIVLYFLFINPYLSSLSSPLREILLSYLVLILSSTMFSSKQDMIDVWVVLLFLGVLIGILTFLRFPLVQYLILIADSTVYTTIMTQLNLYLLYSAIANFAVYMILKLTLGKR